MLVESRLLDALERRGAMTRDQLTREAQVDEGSAAIVLARLLTRGVVAVEEWGTTTRWRLT